MLKAADGCRSLLAGAAGCASASLQNDEALSVVAHNLLEVRDPFGDALAGPLFVVRAKGSDVDHLGPAPLTPHRPTHGLVGCLQTIPCRAWVTSHLRSYDGDRDNLEIRFHVPAFRVNSSHTDVGIMTTVVPSLRQICTPASGSASSRYSA